MKNGKTFPMPTENKMIRSVTSKVRAGFLTGGGDTWYQQESLMSKTIQFYESLARQ